jgi:tetratricopeptide (TPR) repeat protein
MSYINSLFSTFRQYRNIRSEHRYWDLVTDSHLGELFHIIDLPQILHDEKSIVGSNKECQKFLSLCSSWTNMISAAKEEYDDHSENLKSLFRFNHTVAILSSLLEKKLTKRMLFQHCLAFAAGLSPDGIRKPGPSGADSLFLKHDYTRKNVKSAWKKIQVFLSAYHPKIRETEGDAFFKSYNLQKYFHAFFQAKNVRFPSVFVRPSIGGNEGYRASIENCYLWIDVKIGKKISRPKRVNLISLNSVLTSDPYEDRKIGESIESAVLEAVDFIKRFHLKPGLDLALRSIFFQIGSYHRDYDGGSISCAVFFSTLTRLVGRSLPERTFFTGTIGANREAIEGAFSKATKGWERGYKTLVLPWANVPDLSTELKNEGIQSCVRKLGESPPKRNQHILFPYHSSADLYDIWRDLTDSQQVETKHFNKQIHDLIERNRHFTGRKRQLALLRHMFNSGEATVALSGLGGIGKTEISLEYAHRFKKAYNLIWRISGEDPSTILMDYTNLANRLNLNIESAKDENAIATKTIEWLENHIGWMLLVDDVPNPDLLFSDEVRLLPKGGTGHILITSRYHDWNEWCNQITVTKFSARESIQFLLNRTDTKNRRAAAELAEKLGHLPLALAQAAAYISRHRISLKSYIEMFVKQRERLWQEETAPRNYPHTVATTWSIAMAKITREQPMAVDLLNFASLMAPDDIPLDYVLGKKRYKTGRLSVELANRLASLRTDFNAVRRLRDQFRYRLLQGRNKLMVYMADYGANATKASNAISALKNYSLVEGNYESLSVHNLVQTITTDKLDATFLKIWVETAIRLVNQVYPGAVEDKANWPLCSRLLRHALAVSKNAEEKNIMPATNVNLLLKTGRYLYNSAQYRKAEDVHLRALNLAKKCYEPTNLKIAEIYRDLGKVYETGDQYEKASDFYRKALKIDKSVYLEQNPKIAIDLEHLGNVALKLGNPGQALIHYNSAKEYNDMFFVEKHITMARSDFNIGRSYLAKGDFENAESFLESALDRIRKNYYYHHPFSAEIINQLGDMNFLKGHMDRAMDDYTTALKIDRGHFGVNHPQIAEDLVRTAQVMLADGKIEDAQKRLNKALSIYLKAYGDQHHAIAKTYNYLGVAEQENQNHEEAIAYFTKALSLTEKVFDNPNHPLIADIATNYGTVLAKQGQFTEARDLLEMALRVYRKSNRAMSLTIGRGHKMVAAAYHGEQDLQKAQERYFKAYDIYEKLLPMSHPTMTELRENMLELATDFSDKQYRETGKTTCYQTMTIHRKLRLLSA